MADALLVHGMTAFVHDAEESGGDTIRKETIGDADIADTEAGGKWMDGFVLAATVPIKTKTGGHIHTEIPLRLMHTAIPAMIQRGGGRIINIGSVTCVAGYAGLAPYGASRGGVKQLTMSLADDWGVHGITVNCLAPGWFKTAQNAVLYEDREWVSYLCDRIPLKRPGQPDDLDGAVVFLASEASAYITGQTLLVDGGISAGATRATARKQ